MKSAPEGAAVTMEITPEGGYVVKEVTNSLYTDWNSARAASTMDITTSVEMKKVTDNVYTFTMPRACVEVNVEYDIEIPTPAEDKKDEEKEVTDVKMDMEPAGAPETVGEITIIPVSITGVEVPADGSTGNRHRGGSIHTGGQQRIRSTRNQGRRLQD